ncbi:MAG: ribosomal protein S18-alanine N-acetyltransferase [Deltaproteobacteria bacterium]|nr:ribosomal protein S18-alanine N-acetyltransferase [Deltaproteobacteria bacterium]
MDMTIVPLNETYCDAVATLEATCFGTDAWPREVFTELLKTYAESPDFRGQVWVAVDGHSRAVLGYVALEVSSLGEAELTNLAVAPTCRRQGVGRLLSSFVMSICQEIGASLLWLRVRASNRRAVEFYKACGFAVRGEFRDYYEDPVEDALIMAVELLAEEEGEERGG